VVVIEAALEIFLPENQKKLLGSMYNTQKNRNKKKASGANGTT
jgi:hypothetical protein